MIKYLGLIEIAKCYFENLNMFLELRIMHKIIAIISCRIMTVADNQLTNCHKFENFTPKSFSSLVG